jgi:hypothetical protein
MPYLAIIMPFGVLPEGARHAQELVAAVSSRDWRGKGTSNARPDIAQVLRRDGRHIFLVQEIPRD